MLAEGTHSDCCQVFEEILRTVRNARGNRRFMDENHNALDKSFNVQTYRAPVYTNFTDEFGEAVVVSSMVSDSVDPKRYKRKMKKFIEEHKNNLIIQKIRNGQPLTDKELETLEQFLIDADPNVSPDDFREILGENLNLVTFIRK